MADKKEKKDRKGLLLLLLLGGSAAAAIALFSKKTIAVPPPVTHKICFNGGCIDFPGEGVDECQVDGECAVPADTHLECVNGVCVRIAGIDVDSCDPFNDQCGQVVTHKECVNQQCVDINGAGADLCVVDGECVPPPGVVACRISAFPAQVRQGDSLVVTYEVSNGTNNPVNVFLQFTMNERDSNGNLIGKNTIIQPLNPGEIRQENITVGNVPCNADCSNEVFVTMDGAEFDPGTGQIIRQLCVDNVGPTDVVSRQQNCPAFIPPPDQNGFGILTGRVTRQDGRPPPLDRFGQPDTQVLRKLLANGQTVSNWDTDECGDLFVIVANADLPIDGSLWVFSRTGLYPETMVKDRFNIGANQVNDVSQFLVLPI